MKFTTRKIDERTSRILVDGRETNFVVEKGNDPSFGLHREWHVFEYTSLGDGPVMTVYRRKSDAMDAFARIWRQAYQTSRTQGDDQ